MRARVLSSPPTSGSIQERWYDATGCCAWVHFEDREGREWVGVFGSSGLRPGKASVTLFDADRSAFVIAGGQGYIIDTESRELRHRTECAWLVAALAIPERGTVLACDDSSLFAYSAAGLVWRSERIAVDGIRLEAASAAELRGSCDVGEWRSFRLDPASWGFREGPWEIWKRLQES